MKFNFKKVASVLASAVMLSSTVGFAAAASYPAPFVEGGTADGAVVVGSVSAVANTDWAAAIDISRDLSNRVSGETGSETNIVGEGKLLASGSNYIYLGQAISEEVSILTEDDLPTVLASGTFTDDSGTDYDYLQFIDVGDDAYFEFSDSDSDLDNPVVHVEMPSSVSAGSSGTFLYQWRIDFDDSAVFNDSDNSYGEEFAIAGKSYNIGTATDDDELVLLGGSNRQTVQVGESLTMEVNGFLMKYH
jgi:hypothetical protein